MSIFITLLVLALCHFGLAKVVRHGSSVRLPAMGWNSWNEYRCDINETIFLTTGQLLISTGLRDRGYEYVNIDDCWSDKVNPRNSSTGTLRHDAEKFPLGIQHTAKAIHKLGLKLGIYSDAGSLTCGGYAGSLGHEVMDAKTWAEWGVDCSYVRLALELSLTYLDLKYDNCNVPSEWHDDYRWWPENWRGGPPSEDQTNGGQGDYTESKPVPAPPGYDWTASKTYQRYKTMSDALNASSRAIEFSQCAWGHARVDLWGPLTGDSYRMFGDIFAGWSGSSQGRWGIMPILNHASFFHVSANHGSHGDWDMLEVGNGDLTIEENRSHFAMWAALKSPLIIGTPLDGIKPEILEILSNPNLIAFNQDPVHGESAKPYKWGTNADYTWNQTHPAEYWSGQSKQGTHVFAINTLDTPQNRTIVFADVPLLDGTKEYAVYDMWTGKLQGNFVGKYEVLAAGHDTIAILIVQASGAIIDTPSNRQISFT
jgi:alpha-galactosidase